MILFCMNDFVHVVIADSPTEAELAQVDMPTEEEQLPEPYDVRPHVAREPT